VPELNGHWVDGGFRPAGGIDLGVVVSLRRGGLLTPTIAGADALSVDQTMAALRTMVAGARSGGLRSSWMGEASITVTNLGDNGADQVSGLIFPPQVALVGLGRIRERPSVANGEVMARPLVTVTLAGDHRATDGATGSRFLTSLVRALADLVAADSPAPTTTRSQA
jgi:pyruvate dehydrogenase E2 component (dihydrolipoamide acetyltransferase)